MSITDWQVLVIEDEADSMELVRSLLEYQGIDTLAAGSGEAALELLADNVPTLILIDLNLPGIDGWSLLKEIQKLSHLEKVPRVALTAYHSAVVANKAIEVGFDAYFPKPIDATSFVRELEVIVSEGR